MLPTIAEGENFAFRPLPRGWIVCEVWRRPDLSRAEGARLAGLIASHMQRFAAEYAGLVFDLRRAPPIWGPATDEAIGRMLAPWEARAKSAFLVPSSEAIHQIGLRKLIESSARRYGRLFEDMESALAEVELVHSIAGGPRSQRPRSQRG